MEPQRQNKLIEYIPYLIPVVGVVLFGWSPFVVLFYFCVENLLRGLFFVLRGLVMVFNGGGIGFLLVFTLLYLTHATVLFNSIFTFLPQSFSTSLPGQIAIVLNLLILSIPHIADLRIFIRSTNDIEKIYNAGKLEKVSKKEMAERMKKQDVAPLLDFIFDTKEMFNRVIVLWITLPVAGLIIYIVQFLKATDFIDSIILIAIFSFVHYKFEKNALQERRKIWTKQVEWQKSQAVSSQPL